MIRLFNHCPHCGYKFTATHEMAIDGVCVACDFDRLYPNAEASLEVQIEALRTQYEKAKLKRDNLLKKIVNGGVQ